MGLLTSYKEAVLAQLALYEEYPEESHAYCEIVEIWRMIFSLSVGEKAIIIEGTDIQGET